MSKGERASTGKQKKLSEGFRKGVLGKKEKEGEVTADGGEDKRIEERFSFGGRQ